MKWLWLLALMAGFGCTAVNAAPFYDGKSLAHPLIQGLQESSATLAFIKKAGGVKGYYCICDSDDEQPQLLDDFGAASIESVFLMPLDSEAPTRFVLFRQQAQYKVHAYKYDANNHLYSRVNGLQKALDRMTSGQKNLDALAIKKALAKLTPLNYRFYYEESGIPEFDQLDLTQGTLVGYFDELTKPLSTASPGPGQHYYKKTFQEKDGRFLTVTFWRGIDTTINDGSRTLYNYQVNRMAWETDPATFNGSEDGPSVSYNFGTIAGQGTYSQGARTGNWSFTKGLQYSLSGAYVDGKRQGQWTETYDGQTHTGEFQNDLREGRWVLSSEAGESDVSGFSTYLHGQLNGPSEQHIDDVTESGAYRDDKREGPWVTEAGSGHFEDDLKTGPWTLKADNGHTQHVNFVAGKMQGELRETDTNGTLTLIEHYEAGVRSGAREGYASNGKMTFQQHYENGKLNGRAQELSADGSRLTKEMTLRDGVFDGPYRDYLDDGTLASNGTYVDGKFVGTWIDRDRKGAVALETTSCSFDENGPKVGLCGKFRVFKEGKLQSESEYLYGHKQNYVEYNVETGKKTQEMIIGTDDQVTVSSYGSDGGWCTLAKKGFRLMTINQQPVKDYDGAELYGEQLCFHPNGVVSSRYFFDRGFLGCTVNYDETGKEIPERCAPPTPEMERRMQKFIH